MRWAWLRNSCYSTNRSDDSYDGDGDGRRGRAVSIDGLSDLGSGNEDDALHNRVANEERAAMATVPPNAEQDDREEHVLLKLRSSSILIKTILYK